MYVSFGSAIKNISIFLSMDAVSHLQWKQSIGRLFNFVHKGIYCRSHGRAKDLPVKMGHVSPYIAQLSFVLCNSYSFRKLGLGPPYLRAQVIPIDKAVLFDPAECCIELRPSLDYSLGKCIYGHLLTPVTDLQVCCRSAQLETVGVYGYSRLTVNWAMHNNTTQFITYACNIKCYNCYIYRTCTIPYLCLADAYCL